ncbi:MAG: response regulator [Alphaproteobacteria bacterium]|nr:response regulator [Alphaproteobacteria bacterium]
MLTYLGCRVDMAVNGREAFELCEKAAYDLIFMDCNMPVMDGYEATQKIRERYDIDLPIVAISAHAFAQDIQKCYEAGMDDYVQKPVKIDDIRKCLAKWIKPGMLRSAVSAPASPPLEKKEPENHELRIDLAILDDLVGDNKDRQEKLVALILKSAENLYGQIKQSFRNKNRTLLHDSAHALKSTAAQAGGNSLSALCAELERNSSDEGEKSAKIFTKEMKIRFDDEYKYFKDFFENYLAEVRQSRTQEADEP